jgi:CopG family nickel-responsive transcriptional regulator
VAQIVRFGVAMEPALLERFDALLISRGYTNRSEALRDLVRKELDQAAWQSADDIVATLTIVYDHHVRELSERLTELQHDHGDLVISTLHVHLDHEHCLEVIAARGPAGRLKAMADRIVGTRGVLSGHVAAAALPRQVGHHSHKPKKRAARRRPRRRAE